MDHEEMLALRYRPRTFDDVVGQRQVRVLKRMVDLNKVPVSNMFIGQQGTGKTSTGRLLGAALNCQKRPAPCGECSSCVSVREGQSFDVIEVDAASNGQVADIRALQEQTLYVTPGQRKVIIIDEAHAISKQGFVALLKMLESPPSLTNFVLITTDGQKIPSPVLSRCISFRLNKISVQTMVKRLQHICDQEQLLMPEELLLLLSERADGSMRDAVMSLDQVARAGIGTVAEFQEIFGEEDFGPALVSACAKGDHAEALEIVEEQMFSTGDASSIISALTSTLTAVQVLRGGGIPSCRGRALSERQELAMRLEVGKVASALSALWDLQSKVQLSIPSRTALELVISEIIKRLAGAPKPSNGSSQMSLGRMRELFNVG